MHQFGMQEIANTAWSFAQLAFVHVPLLHALSRKAIASLRTGSVQNLTNTAWAFASIKFKNQTLFNSISAEAIPLISAFRQQDLSIMAWSFARQEIRDDNLMYAIAASSIRLLSDGVGRPQEIANLSWALSVLDLRHKPLLESLAGAALRTQVHTFTPQELANTLWAFAGMKYRHEPLIESLASASLARISQVTSQNLVNTAWALDALKWPAFHRDVVRSILLRFTSCCEGSLGLEFVTLASLAKERGILEEIPSFLEEFHVRILDPAVSGLRAIRHAEDDRTLAAEIKRFQDWVLKTQTPHLGEAFTVVVLEAAGTQIDAQDRSWTDKAREAVGRVAWWSCPHAAVSSHGVVAWVVAHLQVGDESVEEVGRVYFADDSAEHSILVERMLQPIFLQASRNGHAERRALIDLLRAVAHAFKYHNSEAWSEVRGTVQLYASHFPCISCLVCIAQFCRRLCRVALQVEFDNAWSAWAEAPVPIASPDVLIMGSAA